MTYESLILSEFSKFGLEPRDGQVETIDQILIESINNGKKFILLNAPTGSGKSIIGIIAGSIIHNLIGKDKNFNIDYSNLWRREAESLAQDIKFMQKDGKDTSLEEKRLNNILSGNSESSSAFDTTTYQQLGVQIVTSTKILQDQYTELLKNQNKYHVNFKGKDNYKCALKPFLGITASSCYKGTPFYYKEIEESEQIKQEYEETCNACEFHYNRFHKNTCDFLLTNYARYYIDAVYIRPNFFDSHGLPNSFYKRTVTVLDEAHTMNENFVSHYTIRFSKKEYDFIMNDIKADFSFKHWTYLQKQLDFIMTGIENKYISKNNYHKSIQKLGEVYKNVGDYYGRLTKWAGSNQATYFKFKAMADKYFCLGCNIGDFFIYENDYVLDMNYNTKVLQVKPLFISKIFKDKVNLSDRVILMSATLTEEIIRTQLKLEQEDYAFIQTSNPFNVSDKKVMIRTSKLIKLSIKNCYDEETNKLLGLQIEDIISSHTQDNGIILVNSFKHGEILKDMLMGITSHKMI